MQMSDATGMYLLPPAPDVCQECAGKHEPDWPHNQQSLYYQYAFWARHRRWPTWVDALAHCSPEMQAAWRAALADRGIQVDRDAVPATGPEAGSGDEPG
ncbi:MAG: hypothetical protein Q8R28_19315 [Dehalococcoidia bacterium]|nr:hypothetical protein [Dehalococcoidia bacterium]